MNKSIIFNPNNHDLHCFLVTKISAWKGKFVVFWNLFLIFLFLDTKEYFLLGIWQLLHIIHNLWKLQIKYIF